MKYKILFSILCPPILPDVLSYFAICCYQINRFDKQTKWKWRRNQQCPPILPDVLSLQWVHAPHPWSPLGSDCTRALQLKRAFFNTSKTQLNIVRNVHCTVSHPTSTWVRLHESTTIKESFLWFIKHCTVSYPTLDAHLGPIARQHYS